MSQGSDGYKPDGWRAVTPRLFTRDVAGLVHFLQTVFDAKGALNEGKPSELRIDDAMLMVSDGGGVRDPTAAFLYVYVPDADLTYGRAVAAGAETLDLPPTCPMAIAAPLCAIPGAISGRLRRTEAGRARSSGSAGKTLACPASSE